MINKLLNLAIVFIFFMGCQSSGVNTGKLSNVDSIRNIILDINSKQQELYKTFSNKQDRSKKYLSYCYDSLITITGYGNQLTNSLDASNDLVDGYADTIHNIIVRVYGNTGRAKLYDLMGKDTLFEDIWISKVFMNFNGQWKMILRNSGPIGVNYKKEKLLPIKALLAFEGVYGIAGDIPDTFKVEGNYLYQFGRNNLRLKYFAFDDSTFFTKDNPGSIVFKKNAGKVNHFDWYTAEGQIIEIPKIEK